MSETTQQGDYYNQVVRENAEIVVDNMLFIYRNKLFNTLVQYEIDGDSDRLLIDLDYWLDFTRDNISLD